MSELTTAVINASLEEEEGGESQLDRAQQVVTDVILPTILVFGILANCLNLLILTRPQMKESPYTYLLGLAMADLGVLVFVFINSVISRHFGKGVYGWQVFDGFIFLPFANMFANSSVWITVSLTVERWVSVKFPLKAKEFCTKKMARRTMFIIVVIVCFANIPRFFCRRIEAVRSSNGGPPFYRLVSSNFEQSNMYTGITWMYITTIHIIPCVTLIFLNICLLLVVYKANKDRMILNEAQNQNNIALHISREQRRLTVTCVSIICLFLVCIIPTALSNPPVALALFARGQDPNAFFQTSVYRLLRIVTNTLLVCNLSLNFVLYCLFNHKFFKTLKHLTKRVIYKVCKIDIPETAFRRMSNSSSGQHKIDHSASIHRSSSPLQKQANSDHCVSYQCLVSTSAVHLIKDHQAKLKCDRPQLSIPLRTSSCGYPDNFL